MSLPNDCHQIIFSIMTKKLRVHFLFTCVVGNPVCCLVLMCYWYPCVIGTPVLLIPLCYWYPCVIGTPVLLMLLCYWYPSVIGTPVCCLVSLCSWYPCVLFGTPVVFTCATCVCWLAVLYTFCLLSFSFMSTLDYKRMMC